MRILGIIPARKGSKGVIGKNKKKIGDKPLIEYTINSAVNSKCFDEIFISTDDPEISQIGTQKNISSLPLRPSELSQDTTPMKGVIKHVIDMYQGKGDFFDAFMILQPTSPLRKKESIQQAVTEFKNKHLDSILSVVQIPEKYHPEWVYHEKQQGLIELYNGNHEPISRRQDLNKAYIREGSIYLCRTENLLRNNNIYGERIGHLLIEYPTINIDNEIDFEQAKKLLLAE